MKKAFVLCLALSLALLFAGCRDMTPGEDTTAPDTTDTTAPAPAQTSEIPPEETTAPEAPFTVPDECHILEHDGVKYDLWEISTLVNSVWSRGQLGKYVIAEGHVNPNMCVYAVIDTEAQAIVHDFSGTVPTWHSDDIHTIVYAHRNSVMAYDGTVLAELTLRAGEYIYNLAYTEDLLYIEATISGIGDPRTEIIDLGLFDAERFFSSIPAEWSQRLFWHRIRGSDDYLYFCNHRGANSTLDGYKKDPPTRFSIYHVNSENQNIIGTIGAEIPSDIPYDTVCPVVVMDGAGSMECEFIVQLTDGEKRFYVSFDNFDWEDTEDPLAFSCRGILSEEREIELKALYPEEFLEAEHYYWHYTLKDFKNENPGDSLVYEGYTVEYECESPYGGTFDFHIHLPQMNSDSVYAQRWNYLYQEYDIEFGERLRKTVHGTNTEYYAHITYNTVTTGDVVTIYIVKSHGVFASGASVLDYDIFHYDTKKERFLTTDEFLAYYAEGQFADYSVAEIVKFMNEITFTADEAGNPYPLTEENILGVIPSVYGEGKFDVVYQGYSVEGSHAIRALFSPYPAYGSTNPKTGQGTRYTYRLTYHDYVDCEDKKTHGTPAGYRLLLSQRVAGQYEAGYYVDCLFTEDIAEPPKSYSLSEHGGYYTPVGQDAYGNMCVFVDHETAAGHLNTVIPFDLPDSAQDYYRGLHMGYFSYDRVLGGSNYTVNENIASQAAQVLDAYRNGKDPNELLPASKTEYTPYPLEGIRENPTANEIGEILKNTSMSEDGTVHFDLDLGDGWRMALPIDIGGFGESVQAYFTGVWFVHGTPKKEEPEPQEKPLAPAERPAGGVDDGDPLYSPYSRYVDGVVRLKGTFSENYSLYMVGFVEMEGKWEYNRPALLYHLAREMNLTREDLESYYSALGADSVPEHIYAGLLADTLEESMLLLKSEYAFYSDGRLYTVYDIYKLDSEGVLPFNVDDSAYDGVWKNIDAYLRTPTAVDVGDSMRAYVHRIANGTD